MYHTKSYISSYTKARSSLTRFKKLTATQKYHEFVQVASDMVSFGCKGLISEMVLALTGPLAITDAEKVTKLYTIAVFMHPFSIQKMEKQYITEAIGDIATKAHGHLTDYVPANIRTAAMYARKYSSEHMLNSGTENLISNIASADFKGLLKMIGAKDAFSVELEFIVDCTPDFVLKYVKDVLNKCYPRVITSGEWFRMVKDASAPCMYEIKTATILHEKELATLYCIILCLETLSHLEFLSVNYSCGTHVHINAEKHNFRTVRGIEIAYLRNLSVINRLMAPNRLFNAYCLPTPCTRRLTEKDLLALPEEKLRKRKYHVVNVLAWFYFKSIEFRQYEGTTNVNSIMAWLEFLHKFVQNYRTVGDCISADTLFKRVGLSNFSSKYFKDKFIEGHRLF